MSGEIGYLVLQDQVEEVVDDFGEVRALDSNHVQFESLRLLDDVERLLGRPTGSESRFERQSRSAAFGGNDVLIWTKEVAFVLGAGGGMTGFYALMKAWLQLKGQRKVRFELHEKDGTRKLTADITGFDEAQVKRILRDNLATVSAGPAALKALPESKESASESDHRIGSIKDPLVPGKAKSRRRIPKVK